MLYVPKILAFAGSLRPGSYNKKLIKIAIEGAKQAGAEVTAIDLRDFPLPVYDQQIQDEQGLLPNVLKLKELMLSNQGFLISAPEYNSSVSGVMKNTIDWTSRKSTPQEPDLQCFVGKVAVLMSASPSYLGGLRGLMHLRSILNNIHVLVLPDQKCISLAHEAFTPDGLLKDPKQQHAIEKLGGNLVYILKKLHG
jgi:chromate reductase, NAD(P)H dehydrogenase (quinone)